MPTRLAPGGRLKYPVSPYQMFDLAMSELFVTTIGTIAGDAPITTGVLNHDSDEPVRLV